MVAPRGACMVAPRGACVVATGGGHAWLLLGGMHGFSRGGHAWLLRGGMRGCSGGMHGCCWGGIHGCSGGACMVAPRGACVGYDEIQRYEIRSMLGGACMVGGLPGDGGGCAWDTTRYRDTINERAVRILLECILVIIFLCNSCKYLKYSDLNASDTKPQKSKIRSQRK